MPPKSQPRSQPQRRPRQGENAEAPLRRSSRRSLAANNDGDGAPHNSTEISENIPQRFSDPAIADETIAEPRPAPSPSLRQPGERLASLRGPGRYVESHAPISSDSQAKTLKFQPKSAVRRSKQEREATEREEAERLQARLAASGISSDAGLDRGDPQGFPRGTFGGVSNRWQPDRYTGGGASGFLGGATPAEDKRRRESFSTRSRGGGRLSTRSDRLREYNEGEATATVNKKPATRRGTTKDTDGDIIMDGSVSGRKKSARVKREEESTAREQSEDELLELEPPGVKRINIEEINLVSSGESSDEVISATDKKRGKEKSKTSKAPGSSFMRPVRIHREAHKERPVGVNTEPTSLASAELRKRAKARVEAPESLSTSGNASFKEKAWKAKKESNKDLDVEFVKKERKWQGVYHGTDDEDDIVKVKEEPKESEDTMLLGDKHTPGTAISQEMFTQGLSSTAKDNATPSHHPKSPASPSQDPKISRKPKSRRAKQLNIRKPVLQTEEDHKEWHRFKHDMALLRHELRLVDQPAAPKIDADGDVEVEETKAQARSKDKKAGVVYLFQLPPIMPNVEDPRKRSTGRKSEADKLSTEDQQDPTTPTAKDTATPVSGSTESDLNPKPKSATTNDPKVKPESPDPDAKPSFHGRGKKDYALPPLPQPPAFPHGTLGTLNLDAEGFPSATWSTNFRLDVGRGSDYAALQEVVLMRSEKVEVSVRGKGRRRTMMKKEDGAEEKEEGTKCGEEAWAVGQMGGGFVMTPDWMWMFGR
ncbi:MAG: hypothetical protein LQ338_005922 [Usnochroma carphineum]|nr:MAG: hypothetical protein LQ338_005922 [Usnochroma carphineum]